jgi:hypothetical protein
VDIVISSQNVIALCTQHGEVIPVEAQDPGLILNSRGYIPLVEHRSLSDNRIGQLDGCPVQQYDIRAVYLQDARQFVGELRLELPPVSGGIDEHAQVIVAHRTGGALNL